MPKQRSISQEATKGALTGNTLPREVVHLWVKLHYFWMSQCGHAEHEGRKELRVTGWERGKGGGRRKWIGPLPSLEACVVTLLKNWFPGVKPLPDG